MTIVTNFYLGSIPVTNELHLVSSGSKSHSVSGVIAVIHGCSFMHWAQQQEGVTDFNARWGGGDVWGASVPLQLMLNSVSSEALSL